MSAVREPIDQTVWQPWIDHVCQALDVDARQVNLAEIHALTGDIAAAFTRPMAPVAAHLAGRALGAGADASSTRAALLDAATSAGSER